MKIKSFKMITIAVASAALAGCCTLFHTNCPTYWDVTADLANQLNKKYGDTNWWQIASLPLGDYDIGMIVDKGISMDTNCVFAPSALMTVTAEGRIPTMNGNTSFDLSAGTPTNITAMTAGLNIDYSRTAYVSYSHLSIQQVIPNAYSEMLRDTNNSICVKSLKATTAINPNTMMIVGYVMGQYSLSSTRSFSAGMKISAYGGNGSVLYTNGDGWAVTVTNTVPCFALIATPSFERILKPGDLPNYLYGGVIYGIAGGSSKSGTSKRIGVINLPEGGSGLSASYGFKMEKPTFIQAEMAVNPNSK